MNKPATYQIADGCGATLHLLGQIGNPYISSVSRWQDDLWYFDNLTSGATPLKSSIRWDFQLPNGRALTDPMHRSLLDSLKRFVWSLFADPRFGAEIKPGSISHLSTGIRYLVSWMVKRDYQSLAELDCDASALFIEELIEYAIAEDSINDGIDDESQPGGRCSVAEENFISFTAAYSRVNVWRLLWRQSDALRDAGIDGLPEQPFNGLSAKAVAQKVTTATIGQIPPLPDLIALALLRTASELLIEPAEDIIKLQSIYLSTYEKFSGMDRLVQLKQAKSKILQFEFSRKYSSAEPWRGPVRSIAGEYLIDSKGNAVPTQLHPVQVLRNLILDIRNACCVVIQGEAGMRISEICSLSVAGDSGDWPAGVSVRRSRTGLNELFYLRGLLAKTTKTPVEVEWLLGCRPLGSKEVPAPVRAIEVLQRLMEPWRSMAKSTHLRESLMVSFMQTNGLPKSVSSIGSIKSEDLRLGQKTFARRYLDWSTFPRDIEHTPYIDTRGACIKTHQWRKNFARYVFQTDSRMIPAIAQQFHHLSLAMTEQGYLGSDPLLIEEMDRTRKASTVDFLYRAARGMGPIAGRLAKVITEHRSELQEIISGKSEGDGKRSLERWVVNRDLQIFFAPHGKCFIKLAPTSARCHEVSGSAHWSINEPNYATRHPSLCAGCSCFAVDNAHVQFWLKRYIENQRAWLLAQKDQKERDYRVVRERADQSLAILLALNEPIPTVEI